MFRRRWLLVLVIVAVPLAALIWYKGWWFTTGQTTRLEITVIGGFAFTPGAPEVFIVDDADDVFGFGFVDGDAGILVLQVDLEEFV